MDKALKDGKAADNWKVERMMEYRARRGIILQMLESFSHFVTGARKWGGWRFKQH